MYTTRYSGRIRMKFGLSRRIFEKLSSKKFHENPSSGSRVVPCGKTDRQTDMANLIVAFRNFANTPTLRRIIFGLPAASMMGHSPTFRRHSVSPSSTLLDFIPLNFKILPVTWRTNSLTFNNCTFCPHCIYVFCIYLRRNSELCHLQHELIGFYNGDEKCLLRGTNWVFK